MGSSQIKLGRLKRVGVREAWASEAAAFTPWLAEPENLELLSEAVGMQLEIEAHEREVGRFRADLLCRDITDGSWVLVENQLERSDHTHLGQLLTYAAGLEAVALIWIAERFTDEHRAAMDWLNDQTTDGIGFFGLEIELWRIGDSEVALRFNVVSMPNEWTKRVVQTRANPQSSELAWDYWAGVLDALQPSGILTGGSKSTRKQDIAFAVGWRNFRLKAYFSRVKKEIGVWVACREPDGHQNLQVLRQAKDQIEREYGGELSWSDDEATKSGYCLQVFHGVDPTTRADWPRQHRLLAERIVRLHRAVSPFVATLDTVDDNGDMVSSGATDKPNGGSSAKV